MKVFGNVMVKDEAIILPHVFKHWEKYPVEKWVFYNDNSSDNTVEVINDFFGEKAIILGTDDEDFSESRNRSAMLEKSRECGADMILSIDADELLSSNSVSKWDELVEMNSIYDIQLYWFNVVGSLSKIRQDPMYMNNYRNFFLALATCEKFNMYEYKYHTPRLPNNSLQKVKTKDIGVVHLQAINKRYYALKQLWYKHYEAVVWDHHFQYINSRYDPVVNNFNFEERDTPAEVIEGMEFDPSIYDEIEKVKGYKDYILKHYRPELVTFGKEYLDE